MPDPVRPSRPFPFPVILIALLLFAANFAYGWPGGESFDSRWQYMQAQSGHYSDWHPPIMAKLWSVLPYFSTGTAPLFTLHMVFYWLGFALVSMALWQEGRHGLAMAVLAVGAQPMLVEMNVRVFKDVGMAVCFLTVFGALFWFRWRERPVSWLAAPGLALLLFYAVLVRHNAIFGAGPLIMYWACPSLFYRPWRFLAVAGVMVAVTLPLSGFIDHTVFKAQRIHPIHSLQSFDIVGSAYWGNNPGLLEQPEGAITPELIDQCYTPVSHLLMDLDKECKKRIIDAIRSRMGPLWISAILKEPMAYLTHRIMHFNAEMFFVVGRYHDSAESYAPFLYANKPKAAPVATDGAKPAFSLRMQWDELRTLLRFNPLFNPAFCLVLALVMVGAFYTARHLPSRQRDAVMCLSLSGLGYMGSFFIVGVASAMRYQFWPLMAIHAAAVIALARDGKKEALRSPRGILCMGIIAASYVLICVIHHIMGSALPM